MEKNKIKFVACVSYVVLYSFFSLSAAYASEAQINYEANLIGAYSHEQGWVASDGMNMNSSIGFEYYQKFANEYGDFLTANLQVRLPYNSREDSEDAWGVEIHNAWLEYKLGLGSFLRAGHIEPAFGLEPALDTHNTLMQTLAAVNLGFKKDWGVKYRGMLGAFDYEIAATLGSGMSIRHKDNSYLVSARIQNSEVNDFRYGASLMYGNTLRSKQVYTIPYPDLVSEETVHRKRLGLDLRYRYGPFDFKAEGAFGENNGQTVGGAMGEVVYTLPQLQKLMIKGQTSYWAHSFKGSAKDDLVIKSVVEYKLSSWCTIRAGYQHDLFAASRKKDTIGIVQLYFFGS